MSLLAIELKSDIQNLREEWQDIRRKRLELKTILLDQKIEKNHLKKDPIYKKLLKDQKKLSVLMKHKNMKLNRLSALEK